MTIIRLRNVPPLLRRRLKAAAGHPIPARAVASGRRGRAAAPTPHDMLWAAVVRRWPEAQREYPLIPRRRLRADIVFPAERLCVEVDGWQFHGRLLADFKRDRDRQNLLTIAGWRLLRIPAGDIRRDCGACCALIALAKGCSGQSSSPDDVYEEIPCPAS